MFCYELYSVDGGAKRSHFLGNRSGRYTFGEPVWESDGPVIAELFHG